MGDFLAEFIAARRWRFASTMPDWPHEYTVKAWKPEAISEFVAFCQSLYERGTVEPWPPKPEQTIYHHKYLVIGDYKYWAMGPLGDADPIDEKTVVNRAPLDAR